MLELVIELGLTGSSLSCAFSMFSQNWKPKLEGILSWRWLWLYYQPLLWQKHQPFLRNFHYSLVIFVVTHVWLVRSRCDLQTQTLRCYFDIIILTLCQTVTYIPSVLSLNQSVLMLKGITMSIVETPHHVPRTVQLNHSTMVGWWWRIPSKCSSQRSSS